VSIFHEIDVMSNNKSASLLLIYVLSRMLLAL